jgi:prevent-host-death family protein
MDVVTNEVGIRQLRLELSKYLKQVQEGAEITVTDHGKPIAHIIPASRGMKRLAELIEAGEVRAPLRAKGDWLPTPIELPPGMTVSDLIEEQRR